MMHILAQSQHCNGRIPPGLPARPESIHVTAYMSPQELHNHESRLCEALAVMNQIFITNVTIPHIHVFMQRGRAANFLKETLEAFTRVGSQVSPPTWSWPQLPLSISPPYEATYMKLNSWNCDAINPNIIDFLADVFPNLASVKG